MRNKCTKIRCVPVSLLFTVSLIPNTFEIVDEKYWIITDPRFSAWYINPKLNGERKKKESVAQQDRMR